MRRQLLLDVRHDGRRGADGDVDFELAEDLLVLGIVDARDGAGDVEALLGDLAGDEVVFVVAGDGEQHVGARRAGLLEHGGLAAVALEHDVAQLVGDLLRLRASPAR